jgi:hypothetical protein
MISTRRYSLVLASLLTVLPQVMTLCACGGGSNPASSPTPTPAPVLSVGGAYSVAVALATNTCGAVTVAPQPTSVTHTPGATRFSLVHGANTFNGGVAVDGSFTTDPLALSDGGTALTVTIQGRFSVTGMNATVTVDARPPAPGAPCRYTVAWTGTKQGAPNVIP